MTTKNPPKNQEYSSASTIAIFFFKKQKTKSLSLSIKGRMPVLKLWEAVVIT